MPGTALPHPTKITGFGFLEEGGEGGAEGAAEGLGNARVGHEEVEEGEEEETVDGLRSGAAVEGEEGGQRFHIAGVGTCPWRAEAAEVGAARSIADGDRSRGEAEGEAGECCPASRMEAAGENTAVAGAEVGPPLCWREAEGGRPCPFRSARAQWRRGCGP